MRQTVLALSLVVTASTAYAQPCSVTQAAVDARGCTTIVPALELTGTDRLARAETLRDEYRHAVIVRNVGIALTAVGVVASVGGAVLGVENAGLCFDNCSSEDNPGQDQRYAAGVGLFAVGQIAATAGIAMWATGGAKASNAKRSLLSIGATGAMVRF